MRASSVNHYILQTLSQEKAHLTAFQVFERVQVHLPAVNQSTVYRSLEKLARDGRVSVSDMGQSALVFEAMTDEPHHHLVCVNCHQVILLPHELIQPFFNDLTHRYQFSLTTNHLILFGYCIKCQAQTEKHTTGG
jgi:Fur family ferric uptake transcriptional regulator